MLWRTLSVASAFIFNILFARYFAAPASGQVFYQFTVFTFVIQLFSFSLESGAAYFTAKTGDPKGRILLFSFLWSMVSSVLAVALYYTFATIFSLPLDYSPALGLAFIMGNMLISFGNAYSYSKYRFVMPGAVASAVNVLLIAVLVVLEHAGHKQHFITVFFCSFLLHGLVLFALIRATGKTTDVGVGGGSTALAALFRYSWLAFVANLLFLLQSRVDYFFVKRYCSAEDLGNYIQVSKIAQAFFMLPSMIAAVLFPVIAGGLQPLLSLRVRTISVLILAGYSVILGVLALSGYWLFPLAYGDSFRRMFIPYLLLVPGIIVISSLYPYTAYFSASNQLAVNVRGSLIAAAIILAGDALLIPKYGMYAAALVSSIGYIAFQLYVLSVFSGQFNISFGKLFTLSRQEFKDALRRVNV